jgi:hypothetical protein
MKEKNFPLLPPIVIGLIILLSLAGVVLFKSKSPQSSFLSPNGQKVLVPSTHTDEDKTKNGNVQFTIQQTSNGKILDEVVTNASRRLNWSVKWINNNKIELNSSDTGTYCWEEQTNGKWSEISC